jgi:hypothetical protein
LDKVTAPAALGPDPVTPEVTAGGLEQLRGVTPSDLWKLVMTDCIQARQEVLGVMAGMDDVPHLHRFPQTKVRVLDAFHDLRRALIHLDEAIKEIETEFPENPTLKVGS